MGGDVTERPGALVEPALDCLRRSRGPFHSDDDLLLAAFYDDTQRGALKAAGPIRTGYPLTQTPLLTLVREIGERPSIRAFQLSVPMPVATAALMRNSQPRNLVTP